jgi:hypothetical protein
MVQTPEPDAVDDLYALPPSAFIAARNALATRLRADGQRGEADEVKALRRPTVAAWAVNHVARHSPELVTRVIDTGADLERGQRRALSGLPDSGIRAATAARRAAVDAATKAAETALHDAGIDAAPHRPKLAATFEAASLGGEDAERVLAGRLSRELPAPSGLGALSGLTLVDHEEAGRRDIAGVPAEEAEQGADEAERTRKRRAAEERAEEAVQRARATRRAADRARVTADEALHEARRLREGAEQAQRRAEEAAAAADDAEEDARRADAAAQARRLARSEPDGH